MMVYGCVANDMHILFTLTLYLRAFFFFFFFFFFLPNWHFNSLVTEGRTSMGNDDWEHRVPRKARKSSRNFLWSVSRTLKQVVISKRTVWWYASPGSSGGVASVHACCKLRLSDSNPGHKLGTVFRFCWGSAKQYAPCTQRFLTQASNEDWSYNSAYLKSPIADGQSTSLESCHH